VFSRDNIVPALQLLPYHDLWKITVKLEENATYAINPQRHTAKEAQALEINMTCYFAGVMLIKHKDSGLQTKIAWTANIFIILLIAFREHEMQHITHIRSVSYNAVL
jgi:uncharacterized MAPEG superfamily protein